MGVRISSLALSSYLMVGLIVLVAVWLSGSLTIQSPAKMEQQMAAELFPKDKQRLVLRPVISIADSALRQRVSANAAHRFQELESLVAQQDELLEKTNALLKLKNQESVTLRRQRDGYLDMLTQFVEEDRNADQANPKKNASGSTNDELAQLQTQLLALQIRLAETENRDLDREIQLSELQQALDEANNELAADELAALASSSTLLKNVASEMLVRVGAPVVPTLSELLVNERIAIRIWAARVLGGIGQDAVDASGLLREMLADPNDEVRTAARNALNSILD